MSATRVLSVQVQKLIARISLQMIETEEVIAVTRARARETRHIISPRFAASETSDSLSYENDWDVPLITAAPEAVQS